MEAILRVIFLLVILSVKRKVDCKDLQPTFRYVTTYNRDGILMTKDTIQKTSVNVLRPIIFVINGLTNVDQGDDLWKKELVDEYLQKFLYNLFIVDWDLPSPPDPSSIDRARTVGQAVGDFIGTLFNKTGESYLDIHLVGVSLGYEVAASASRRLVSELSGRKINRITGLDPAYYLINDEADAGKLSRENAGFVDVVHSNLSKRAELKQIGHADFYVDGAGDGCDTKDSNDCALLKLITLFAKSINTNEIKARKCDSVEDFRKGACESGEEITFGENVDKTARGKYFLKYQPQ